ncbi:MAG: glycosyltransferase [Myxococcota bacterium]|nr:glycosyltransferase [Myxococcota bacterium]
MTSAPRTVVCTVVSANYLARARVLMNSLRTHHPDWVQHVLIVDEIGDRFDPAGERFSVSEVGDLPFESPRELFFRYDILELNTAVKPFFFRWLFEEYTADRVIYLDPDIEVYAPLAEVEGALDAGALMCLTPHLTGVNDDDGKPSDLDILVAGSYNLGFLALGRHPNLYPFLDWWWGKLEFECLVDFQRGLFVDQKWMDLAPGIFGDAHIIRDPGYNVAYWNLPHRNISTQGEDYFVNENPLVFFHFSGLDPEEPTFFSKHQDRYTLRNLGALRPLIDQYCKRVLEAGHGQSKNWPYAFDVFADGETILPPVRHGYRNSEDIRTAAGEDPFAAGARFLNESLTPPGAEALVTRVAYLYWQTRTDLQVAYPSPIGSDAPRYARWFVEEQESQIPARFKSAMLSSLSSAGASVSPWKIALRQRLFRHAHKYSAYLRQRLPRDIYLAAKEKFFRWAAPPLDLSETPFGTLTTPRKVAWVRQKGFHPQDEYDRSTNEAWMGEQASLEIPNYGGGRLKITGTHTAFEYAPALEKLHLSISIAGETIGGQQIDQPGKFSLLFELPEQHEGSVRLGIESSHSFSPTDLGLGDDSRTLSVRIGEISLNHTVLVDFSEREIEPVNGAGRSPHTPGLNIVGYFQQELGIAESARLASLAAEASPIPHGLVDFSKDCSSAIGEHPQAVKLQSGNPYSINLFHINADQMPSVWRYFGPDFFQDRYNVGVWHWELPEFPDEWISAFSYVHELWAPSRFIQDAITAKSSVPVIHMPHAMGFDRPQRVARSEFGLPEDAFLFLSMYDMHSFQARKNPKAVLESFKLAADGSLSGKMGLVIKVMNPESQPDDFAELRNWAEGTPNVSLITETLSRNGIYRLEACCDAFISLHRSEGWGLGLAESMYLQKPVIATGWSGNLDFMTPENSVLVDYELVSIDEDHGPYKKGQIWAEPKVEHAADWMQRLVEDKALRDRLALNGRQTMESDYSPVAIGRRYEERFRILQKRLRSES